MRMNSHFLRVSDPTPPPTPTPLLHPLLLVLSLHKRRGVLGVVEARLSGEKKEEEEEVLACRRRKSDDVSFFLPAN